jgi:hypothetical protein
LTPTINKRFAKEYRGVLSDSDPGAKCWWRWRGTTYPKANAAD